MIPLGQTKSDNIFQKNPCLLFSNASDYNKRLITLAVNHIHCNEKIAFQANPRLFNMNEMNHRIFSTLKSDLYNIDNSWGFFLTKAKKNI